MEQCKLGRFDEIVTCRHCRVKMVEQKRSFHKQRKWVCPRCGRARMQQSKQLGKGDGKHER